MGDAERVREAIRHRQTIVFRYARGERKTPRVGHPHVVYVAPTGKTLCLLYQTAGASDSGAPVPGWRSFELPGMRNVVVLRNYGPFAVRKDFDGHHPRYANSIETVSSMVNSSK